MMRTCSTKTATAGPRCVVPKAAILHQVVAQKFTKTSAGRPSLLASPRLASCVASRQRLVIANSAAGAAPVPVPAKAPAPFKWGANMRVRCVHFHPRPPNNHASQSTFSLRKPSVLNFKLPVKRGKFFGRTFLLSIGLFFADHSDCISDIISLPPLSIWIKYTCMIRGSLTAQSYARGSIIFLPCHCQLGAVAFELNIS